MQVGVVVVDLASALGREDHELVLGVDLREQVVDGRVDDPVSSCRPWAVSFLGCLRARSRDQSPGTASNSTTSWAAWPTSWLTTFKSNSSWAANSMRAVASRRGLLGRILGAPADQPAHQFVPGRRQQEHQQRLRHRRPDRARALQIDLEQHALALRERRVDRRPRGAVAVGVVHRRVLEQLAALDQPSNCASVDEVVVLAVDLARPRRPGRRRDAEQTRPG